MNEKLILTPYDIKEILHIGNDKAYKLFSQKSFPSFRIEGTWYVKYEDFMRWCDKIQTTPGKSYTMN